MQNIHDILKEQNEHILTRKEQTLKKRQKRNLIASAVFFLLGLLFVSLNAIYGASMHHYFASLLPAIWFSMNARTCEYERLAVDFQLHKLKCSKERN